MIDLTPLEVRQKKGDFRRAMRGYEPELVNDFLDLVADRMEELVKENMALRDAAGSVQDELAAYRHKEQALSEALMSAQKLREEARSHAEREGDLVLREARLAAESLRQNALRQAVREEEALRQVRARRIHLVESFRQLLERQMRELDVIQETLDLQSSSLGPQAQDLAEHSPAGTDDEPRTPGLAGAGATDVPEGPQAPDLRDAPAAEAIEGLAPDVPAEPTVPGQGEEPAVPGLEQESTVPGHGEEPAVPGLEQEPAVPGPGEEPAVPGFADLPAEPAAGEEEAVEGEPLNLEWPVEEMVVAEEPREKRTPPEGFDAADEGDEDQDDWLSSLMEE
jgi:cell division initiation protein